MRSLACPALLWLLATVGSATACAAELPAPTQQPVNPDAKVQQDFVNRVKAYVDLREKAINEAPKLSNEAEPEQIAAHQAALLDALRRLRPTAKQGDVFQPDVRALIRRRLHGVITTRPGSQTKTAINEENPGAIKIAVNGKYPDGVALTTVPPQVLEALPRLPEKSDLEYRFVGRRLLLLDSRAKMVVDYIENAMP
jgi:hypothetical protein